MITATHLYSNHPPAPYSLATRNYLVKLPFERATLFFSIKSDEADTPAQALAVALGRLPETRKIGTVELGKLKDRPTIVKDNDQVRVELGIRQVGYPSTFRERKGRWY